MWASPPASPTAAARPPPSAAGPAAIGYHHKMAGHGRRPAVRPSKLFCAAPGAPSGRIRPRSAAIRGAPPARPDRRRLGPENHGDNPAQVGGRAEVAMSGASKPRLDESGVPPVRLRLPIGCLSPDSYRVGLCRCHTAQGRSGPHRGGAGCSPGARAPRRRVRVGSLSDRLAAAHHLGSGFL